MFLFVWVVIIALVAVAVAVAMALARPLAVKEEPTARASEAAAAIVKCTKGATRQHQSVRAEERMPHRECPNANAFAGVLHLNS